MNITEINMTNLRSNLADALDQASVGDVVVVKRRGKQDAALIDSSLLEDFMAATNPRIVKKVARARAEAKTGKTVSFDKIFQEVTTL